MQAELNVTLIARGDAHHQPSGTVINWRVPIKVPVTARLGSCNDNAKHFTFLEAVDHYLNEVDRVGGKQPQSQKYINVITYLCKQHLDGNMD